MVSQVSWHRGKMSETLKRPRNASLSRHPASPAVFKSDYVHRLFQQSRDRPRPVLSLMASKRNPNIHTVQLLEMIREVTGFRKPHVDAIRFSTGQLLIPERPWTWVSDGLMPIKNSPRSIQSEKPQPSLLTKKMIISLLGHNHKSIIGVIDEAWGEEASRLRRRGEKQIICSGGHVVLCKVHKCLHAFNPPTPPSSFLTKKGKN